MLKLMTSLCVAACISLPLYAQTLVLEHAKIITASSAGELEDASIVIQNGKISAVGETVNVPAGAEIMDMTGRTITPGLVAANTTLGVVEINDRANANDSSAKTSDLSASVEIQYAVNPASTLIPVARNGGISRAIVTPGLGSGSQEKLSFGGQGAVIATGDGQDPIILPHAGVTINLRGVKTGRAAMFPMLKALLEDVSLYAAKETPGDMSGLTQKNWTRADLDALAPVARGEAPLVIEVDRASDISQMLKIGKALNLKMVLVGAAEGWVVADEIAEAGASVVLNPIDNLPSNFDQVRASIENATRLNAAGVRLALTSNRDGHDVRLTRYHAGMAVAHGLPYDAAVKAITVNPARMFGDTTGGEIAVGQDADIAVWSGDPLQPLTDLVVLYVRGEAQPKTDRLTVLRKKYVKSGE
ncbi:amidohydrolase family protein [Hyphomonas pacifica]|uniref:Amidohydrolase-related domain-containing protein n=1 Tax=Hyphomonas pacifica TaxID=1280941 RepID=A0A062TZY3_9PROT|nr:amidohydrolase family protein [Hyphomonas pacifica]KCZ49247.1 hypothetical protein HY2_15410 [Hyphomonas pacifica]RAN31931.1 hypothetical protein HY3_16060 [Hyphomonas pacifica]